MTHTLLKGTPTEVAADLLAIDNEIAELKRQRNSFLDCFQYELDANIRLEKEIKRLRESLMDIGGTFHAIDGITMAVNAALHPLPNNAHEPRA